MKTLILFVLCIGIAVAQWSAPVSYSGNPVGLAGAGGSWTNNQFNDPVPVIPCVFDATRDCFYVGGCAGESAGVGNSCSGAQTIGYGTAPISNPLDVTWNASPTISDVNRRLDSIVNVNNTGTSLYLYSTNTSGANQNIDQFVSSDGGRTFSLSHSGVLTPTGQGCADGTDVSQFAVLQLSSNSWIGYYSYRTSANFLGGVRAATSTDGITWTKSGCVDLFSTGPTPYDRGYIEFHSAYVIGDSIVMLYESWSGQNFGSCSGANCGCVGGKWTNNVAWTSLSTPSGPWQKSSFNPLLTASGVTNVFDQSYVATPAWFQAGGQNYLLYQGEQQSGCYLTGPWSLGAALLSGTPLDFVNHQVAGPAGVTP